MIRNLFSLVSRKRPFRSLLNSSSARSISSTDTETDQDTKRAKTSPLLQSINLLASTKKIWKPIVWIDCEMTGLDVAKDNIIEICCIITDGNLKIVDEVGYESTVYVPKSVLDSMNEWCIVQHNKLGLVKRILDNPQQTLEKVQDELLTYIKKYISEPKKAVLAGNSVHMDKFFMMKEFPQVIDHLHYRLIDVSSFLEFGWRHNPDLMRMTPKKAAAHTAKADILESINQLKWYRQFYFKTPKETAGLVLEPVEGAKEETKTETNTETETKDETKESEASTSATASAEPSKAFEQKVIEKVEQKIEQKVQEKIEKLEADKKE